MYSKSFKEYILSDETLKKVQGELFKILLDVKYVCEKYDIKYMLAGGTMLGAVRHKGFIPWDDDIDLFMFREEAEKLRRKKSTEGWPASARTARSRSRSRSRGSMLSTCSSWTCS